MFFTMRFYFQSKIIIVLLFLLAIGAFTSACNNNEIQNKPFLEYPKHFPSPQYPNIQNQVTAAGFELGKMLFYDKNLSLTRTLSCGSCHAQVHGFADHNVATSFGIFNRQGIRNSPAIMNMAWGKQFMWDGGINHLDLLPLAPITDTTEMGLSINSWIDRITQQQVKYGPLFRNAFGSDTITEKKILLSLSQFMLSLVSSNSKYDQVIKGEQNFNPLEAQGYEIFKLKCNSCHTEPLFSNSQFERNGYTQSGLDRGRMRITELPTDLYKFKVPSLRNLEFTYPYMHDGKVQTLDEVLNHYSNNQLHVQNEKIIPLQPAEKEAITAFLKTLTDYQFISNLKFSEPR